MFALALLKGIKFAIGDMRKVVGFGYTEQIFNLYIHKYLFGNPVCRFKLKYVGIINDEFSVNLLVESKKGDEFLPIPYYVKNHELAYKAVINILMSRQVTFSTLWKELSTEVLIGRENISELDTVNILFSNDRVNMYTVYHHLLRHARSGVKTYKMFELDKVLLGSTV